MTYICSCKTNSPYRTFGRLTLLKMAATKSVRKWLTWRCITAAHCFLGLILSRGSFTNSGMHAQRKAWFSVIVQSGDNEMKEIPMQQ